MPRGIPDACGRVLEWHAPAQSVRAVAAVLMMVTLMAFLTFKARGFEWATVWFFWALVVGFGLLVFFGVGRQGKAAAGADWFADQRAWVRTYELVEVRIRRSVSWDVLLRDARGEDGDAANDVAGEQGSVGSGLQRDPALGREGCEDQSAGRGLVRAALRNRPAGPGYPQAVPSTSNESRDPRLS